MPLRDDVYLLSNSEQSDFKDCRRRWWLRWVLGLVPRREEPFGPRALGTRVHAALAEYYGAVLDGMDEGAARASATALLAETAEEDRARLEESDPPPAASDLKALADDVELAGIMLEGYFDWLEETGADRYLVPVAAEHQRTAPLGEVRGTEFRLIELLDLKVRNEEEGSHSYMDHKTTDSFSRLTQTAHLDGQLKHYCLIDRLTGEEGLRADGGTLNMLRKVKRTARAKPPFYARHTTRHNEETLRSHWMALTSVAADIVDVLHRLDAGEDHRTACYPSPSKECSWKCDYFRACGLLDDGTPEDWALAEFDVRDGLEGRYDVGAL